MTTKQVINKLSLELAFQTGKMEDVAWYKKYIGMALSIGIDHFTKNMEEIVAMDHEGRELGRYNSIIEAGRKLGIRESNIHHVLAGRNPTAGGYKFILAKDQILIKCKDFKDIEPSGNKPYSGYRKHSL